MEQGYRCCRPVMRFRARVVVEKRLRCRPVMRFGARVVMK